MKSVTTMLNDVKTALTGISGLSVFHYSAGAGTSARYCVWMETGEQGDGMDGDNHKVAQTIEGTIDLFTKTESDSAIDAIQSALANAGIGFYLNSVQYEDSTELIHYEWYWSVS